MKDSIRSRFAFSTPMIPTHQVALHRHSGFTIVELLIVIVIIGILATLVIVTFSGVQQKARDSERKTDINAIAGQLEGSYAINGSYPTLAGLNDSTRRAALEIKLDLK